MKKHFITFLLLLVALSSIAQSPPTSLFQDMGTHNGSRYYLSHSGYTWNDALALANIYGGINGHLVAIKDTPEEVFVKGLTTDPIWLGFTDHHDENSWIWTSGEPVIYTNWQTTQPDNFGGQQHYGVLNLSTNWDDVQNAYYARVVLEINPSVSNIEDFTKLIGLGGVTDDSESSFSTSWIDYDNDNDDDIFIANKVGINSLYRNNGDGTFTKMTGSDVGTIVSDIGSSFTAVFGDYNNDGWIDAFIAQGGNIGAENNFLYINNNGFFTRVTGSIVEESNWAFSASFGDLDNDGYLDLYVGCHGAETLTGATGEKNHLYKNNGNGTFTKITTGDIVNDADASRGINMVDTDNDGDLDIFVANQYYNNAYYENQGSFNFIKNTTDPIANEGALRSNGGSFADIDGDLDLDLFVSNTGQQNNLLYLNDGSGNFTQVTTGELVNDGGYSSGSSWLDLDNDGDLDLIVGNSQNLGPNFIYYNNGSGVFEKKTNGIIANELFDTKGLAFSDFDRNGTPDLYLSSVGKNGFYRNNLTNNNWIALSLIGTLSNKSGIGSKVKIKADGKWQIREMGAQNGRAGQNSLDITFGLGQATVIDSVIIHWTSGNTQILTDIIPNQFITIIEGISATKSFLAEKVFTELYGAPLTATTPADNFPSPFGDLSESAGMDSYQRMARVLSYLEFQDGQSVFRRNRFYFHPTQPLKRAEILRIILEAWHITPDLSAPSPFVDVQTSDENYGYINKAVSLGIVPSGGLFNPNAFATEDQVNIWFSNLIALGITPTSTDLQNIDNYFVPGNYTEQTLGQQRGLEDANFNHYVKSSFGIRDINYSLSFIHTYNSYITELPELLHKISPLGTGWTHNYHSYIIKTSNVKEDGTVQNRYIINYPDATIHMYNPDSSRYETIGVYDDFRVVSDNIITITKKNQTVYTFEKFTGGSEIFYYLVSVKDRNANELKLEYEQGHSTHDRRISKVIAPSGRSLTMTYRTGTNLLEKVEDPSGRNIQFFYTDGNLASFKDAKNQTTTYDYFNPNDPLQNNLLRTITLPKGNTITNSYYQRKLTGSKISPTDSIKVALTNNYGGTNPNEYTHTALTDENGAVHHYDFNQNNLPTHITSPGLSYNISYPTSGINISKPSNIALNGINSDIEYDSKGNPIKVTRPLGVVEEFTYNSTNDVVNYKDPKGNITIYEYSPTGNLTKITDALGNETIQTFTAQGLLASYTTQEGMTVNFYYSPNGDLLNVSGPLGYSITNIYDAVSRLTSQNVNGLTTSFSYDANDNMISQTNSLNHTTQYEVDLNDNLTKIINPNSSFIQFTYNTYDEIIEINNSLGNAKGYEYNEDASLKKYILPDGQFLEFTYDTVGRVTSDGFSNVVYDTLGNITEATNANGTITFTYDGLSRTTSVTDYYGNVVGYAYDLNSNITAITYPNGKVIHRTFDAKNRLKTVSDWNGHTTTYTYRKDGLLKEVLYPNNTKQEYFYDALGRPNQAINYVIGGDTLSLYEYEWDLKGNILSETMAEPYALFNSAEESTINYTVDLGNQIQTANATNFTHDANGNVTSKGSMNFATNAKGELTSITSPSFNATYQYDAFGYRREATRNGITTRYALDIIKGLPEVIMETDDSGNPTNYYIYGLGLISRIKADESTTHYYHYNFQGSTIALTDQNAEITHRYSYGDFGEVTKIEELDHNPFRFNGMVGIMHEVESIYFMRARYYDAEIGRFLSEDPIFSTNLYPFNNPVTQLDPSGNVFVLSISTMIAMYAEFRIQSLENRGNIQETNWKEIGIKGIKSEILGVPVIRYRKGYELIKASPVPVAISHYFPEVAVVLPELALIENLIEQTIKNGINGIEDGFRITGKHIEDGFKSIGKRIEKVAKKAVNSIRRGWRSVRRRFGF